VESHNHSFPHGVDTSVEFAIGDVVYCPSRDVIGVVEGWASWLNNAPVIGSPFFGLIIGDAELWFKIGEL
jgi:hypothetical protein